MILTLCGSARFEPYFHEANKQLTLAGHSCFTMATWASIEGSKDWLSTKEKQTFDLVYLAKIESSDGVVMLNIPFGGRPYLGESSLRELEWARMRHKLIFWTLNDDRARIGSGWNCGERYIRGLLHSASGEWTELLNTIHNQ